ncbi:hypothetical protein F5Y03DRAFT_65391 [Xylaria venustula]|nr:hypothetical protein F5Y03DRAFT_65391 [Xylaria venustula]
MSLGLKSDTTGVVFCLCHLFLLLFVSPPRTDEFYLLFCFLVILLAALFTFTSSGITVLIFVLFGVACDRQTSLCTTLRNVRAHRIWAGIY